MGGDKAKGHLGLTWVAAGDPRQQTRTFGSRAIQKCRPAMSNFPGVTTCVDPLFSSAPSSQLYKCRPVTYLVTGGAGVGGSRTEVEEGEKGGLVEGGSRGRRQGMLELKGYRSWT